MDLYLINSIYRATEGEGIYIGTPQIFIRYQGCDIFCDNCDSKDTWKFDHKKAMSLDEVLLAVEKESRKGEFPLKRASITGGDPLNPIFKSGLLKLIEQLKLRGFYINIEAAGNIVDKEIFSAVDFISFDFKTPSTKVDFGLGPVLKMIENFNGKFQVKSVISGPADFEATKKAKLEIKKTFGDIDLTWCLTPEINPNESFGAERFMETLSLNESIGSPFRVIGQQHKWVFGPDAKQV